MSKVEFRRPAGGRLAKPQKIAVFFKRMVFRIRKQGLGLADNPNNRTAFSFRISGRTSSLMPIFSKSASQRSGVING